MSVIVTNRLDNAREKGKKANRAKIICVSAVVTTIIGLPVALDAIGGWFSGEPGLIPARISCSAMSSAQRASRCSSTHGSTSSTCSPRAY